MHTQSAFLRLVEAIYEGALRDEAWKAALRDLMMMLEGSGMLLMVFDPKTGIALRMDNVELDPDVLAAYESYWCYHDPRFKPAVEVPTGQPFTERLLVPTDEWRKSAILNELLIPNDVTQMLGVWIEKSDSRVISIAVQRPSAAPSFGEWESKLMRDTVPHLQRSLRIKDQLRFSECRLQSLIDLIDRLPFGILLLDSCQRIIEASSTAKTHLVARDGIASIRGVLRCHDSRDSEALKSLLANSASSDAKTVAAGSISVRRARSKKPLLLSIIPVSRVDSTFLSPSVTAIAVVFDPCTTVEPPTKVIQEFLGVSMAEARLVSMLSQGYALKGAAARLSITANTARTHLKSVFAKTGLHSQSALLQHLATSHVLLAPRSHPAASKR